MSQGWQLQETQVALRPSRTASNGACPLQKSGRKRFAGPSLLGQPGSPAPEAARTSSGTQQIQGMRTGHRQQQAEGTGILCAGRWGSCWESWRCAGGLLVQTADGATRQGREGDATLTRTGLQATRLERTQEPTAGQNKEQEQPTSEPGPLHLRQIHQVGIRLLPQCTVAIALQLIFYSKKSPPTLVLSLPPPLLLLAPPLPPSCPSAVTCSAPHLITPRLPLLRRCLSSAPLNLPLGRLHPSHLSLRSVWSPRRRAQSITTLTAVPFPVARPGPSVSVGRPRRPTDPISLASGLLLALRFAPCRGLWSCRVATDSHSHSLHHILAPSIPPGNPSFILFHSTRFLLHFFAASLVPF